MRLSLQELADLADGLFNPDSEPCTQQAVYDLVKEETGWELKDFQGCDTVWDTGRGVVNLVRINGGYHFFESESFFFDKSKHFKDPVSGSLSFDNSSVVKLGIGRLSKIFGSIQH